MQPGNNENHVGGGTTSTCDNLRKQVNAMANLIATVLSCIWIAAITGGFGYMIYTFIRDDRRSEKKRKEELQKNKEL